MLCLALNLVGGSPVFALSVWPTNLNLNPKSDRQTYLNFEAPLTEDLALEFEVFERRPGQGRAASVRAREEIISVKPPLLFLPKGESGRVQISWHGPPRLAQSQSFFVLAAQVSPKSDPNASPNSVQSEVTLLARVFIPLHVSASPYTAPDLRLTYSFRDETAFLINHGQMYARVRKYQLVGLSGSGDEVFKVGGSALARFLGTDAVLPGEELAFSTRTLRKETSNKPVDLALQTVEAVP